MPEREQVVALFADTWSLYDDAIEILELGKQRIDAESAWGATMQAANALILAGTGRGPSGTGQTTRRLNYLGQSDPALAALVRLYNDRIVDLHGRCFYSGVCNEITGPIRETADYVRCR